MNKKNKKVIFGALEQAESIACDLSAVLDNLNPDNEQEHALGAVIFNLTCEIYEHHNKIKKILDTIK